MLEQRTTLPKKVLILLTQKKSIFIFRMQKMGYFVKQLPKICRKIGALHYLKILDHIVFTDNQMVMCQTVSIYLS